MRHTPFFCCCLLVAGVLLPASKAVADEPLPKPLALWSKGAPGAMGNEDADVPTLTPYLAPPKAATGAAVIICPGGGYHHLAESHGEPVARWLNSIGVAGFVLKYRHLRYKHPIPWQDGARAVRTVRARAAEWKLDPKRIGILGFSAGGHLATMNGTHFDAGRPDDADPIERVSSRPDLMVLSVSVITMRPPFAHAGSVRNLLGEEPEPKLVQFCSTDQQVTAETPPTFIVDTWNDRGVPVENSLMFAAALRKAGVPCELHVYEEGPHNFLVATGETRRVLDTWWDRLADWLRLHRFAAPGQAGPVPR